jgi:hypothetical protein
MKGVSQNISRNNGYRSTYFAVLTKGFRRSMALMQYLGGGVEGADRAERADRVKDREL